MKKVSYEEVLFADEKFSGFSVSFYASNLMQLERLIDEAQLIAKQDLNPQDYFELFGSLEVDKNSIDTFPAAVFLNAQLKCYVPLLSCREEIFVVSNSFHVKPLIKLHQRNKHVALLHFAKTEVKLFQVTMKNLVLLDIFEQPQKEQDYVQIDRFVTKLLAEKKLLLIFCGALDRIELFKKVSFYGNSFAKPLMPTGLQGKTFIQHIFRHVEPHFKRLEWKTAERFSSAKKQGKLVTQPEQILGYASRGQVKLLFIAEDKMLWGYLDTRKKEVLTHERQRDAFDEDVLDDLSELVLKHRGSVFVLPQSEMPCNQLIFAVLRDDYEKIIFEKKALKTAG